MTAFSEALRILITADGAQAVGELRKVAGASEATGKSLDSMSTKMIAVGAAAVVGGAVVGKELAKMAQSALDVSIAMETAGKVFGTGLGQVDKFATGAAESLGLSKVAALSTANAFGLLASQGGLAGDGLASAASNLTTRAADIAKGLGLNFDDVVSKLEQGLKGGRGAKQLLTLGINLDPANLKASAIEDGVASKGTSALTQQQRTLEAYNVIMRDSSRFAGELAKHHDDLAEKVKRAKAEFTNVKAEIGAGVLPVFTQLASGIGGIVHSFESLPGPVKEGVGTLAALAAGLSVVGGAGSLVVGGLSKLGAAMSTLTDVGFGAAATEAGVVSTELAAADVEAQALAGSVGEVDAALAAADTEAAGLAVSIAAAAAPLVLIATAVAGFGYAIKENNKQAKEGLALATGLPKGVRTNQDVVTAASDISQKFEVGPLDAAQKLKDLVGLYDDAGNRALVAQRGIDALGKAIGSESIDKGRETLTLAKTALEGLGLSSEQADRALKPLYDQLNKRIDTANQLSQVKDQLDVLTPDMDTAAAAADRMGTAITDAFDAADAAAKKAGESQATWLQRSEAANKALRAQVQPALDYASATNALADAQKKLADLQDPSAAAQRVASGLDALTSAQDALTSAIDNRARAQKTLNDLEKQSAVGGSVLTLAAATKASGDALAAARQQLADAQANYGADSDQANAARSRVANLTTDTSNLSGFKDQALQDNVKNNAAEVKAAGDALTKANHDVTRAQQGVVDAQSKYNDVLKTGGFDLSAIHGAQLTVITDLLNFGDAQRNLGAAAHDGTNPVGDLKAQIQLAGQAAGLTAPQIAAIAGPLGDIAKASPAAIAAFQKIIDMFNAAKGLTAGAPQQPRVGAAPSPNILPTPHGPNGTYTPGDIYGPGGAPSFGGNTFGLSAAPARNTGTVNIGGGTAGGKLGGSGASVLATPARQQTSTINNTYQINSTTPVETANEVAARMRSSIFLAGLR